MALPAEEVTRSNARELATGFVGDPWNRQPGETDKSFVAFTIYRDMGPDRTLTATDREYRRRNGGRPLADGMRFSGRFGTWSSEFRWKERAAAYDSHMDAREVTAARRRRVRAASRHADQQEKVQEVLMHAINKSGSRIEDILEGRRADDLENLSTEDLLKLGRHMAVVLAQSQKAETDALDFHDARKNGGEGRQLVRGKILRQVLNRPDMVGMLEQVAFEISAGESEDAAATPTDPAED